MMHHLGRTQRAILACLQSGSWVRGEQLAADAGVRHKLLWPYVQRLRDRGVTINACNKRGYRLPQMGE